MFCNKPLKAFLERQMSKDKPTPLKYDHINWGFKVPVFLFISIYKNRNKNVELLYYFDATTSHLFYSHLFLYSIFSTTVTTSHSFKLSVTVLKKKRYIYAI